MEVEKRRNSRGNSRAESHDARPGKTSPRKRSYQRDHNSRKNCWQSRNENTVTSANDDLRSPCHKHPRFKVQNDGTPTDKPRGKGTWNNKFDSRGGSNQSSVFKKDEFPPLGFDMERFTPESNKDWGSIVDEEEQKTKATSKENQKPNKFKRRLLLSASDETKVKTENEQDKKSNTKETKSLRPILTDKHKLAQRQKQIDIGKNTVSYGQYIKTVQRQERSKEDPQTPDKFQQCSTRSWVGQIKVWRRRLHSYDLDSKSKEDLFSTSSTSSSQATDDLNNIETEEPTDKATTIEDMFKCFDLDSCLHDDGFPL